MGFKKGHSGNPKGKPKGAKGTKTLEWEQFGRELLEHGMPRALSIMQTCEDEKFLSHFTSLLEYFKPKLARSEVKHEGETTLKITFLEDGADNSKS